MRGRDRLFSVFLVALAFAVEAGARDLPSHPGKAACVAGPTALCLNGGRFRVEIAWKDFDGRTGAGRASALTDDTGTFWFFDPANIEVTAKVLDGRAVNGNWWFFFGALTNVEYRITLTDTVTGARKIYAHTNRKPEPSLPDRDHRRGDPGAPGAGPRVLRVPYGG